MKISMHMLAQWLKKYNPIFTIQGNEHNITGARLFSEEIDFFGEFLYVGRMTDFFQENSTESIVLVHQADVLCLEATGIEAVMNDILAAFDFYNRLETVLVQSVYEEEPEQKIISACEALMGPMFLMKKDYHILACSQNFRDQKVNHYWDYFSVNRRVSVEDMARMRFSQVVSLMGEKQYFTEFREPNAYPYEYGLMCSYCDSAGRQIGHLIAANINPITPFEKSIMEIIMEALDEIQKGKDRTRTEIRAELGPEVILTAFLSGIGVAEDEEILRSVEGWKAEDAFCVLVFDTEELNVENEGIILREQLRCDFGAVTAVHKGCICCLLRLPPTTVRAQERLKEIKEKIPFRIGVSNPFRLLRDSNIHYKQAVDALHLCNGKMTFFKEAAVYSLILNKDHTEREKSRHPLVPFLENYDSRNSTLLGKTLFLYLKNERSIKRTADLLFVHRNTVSYRLEKIQSMYEVDLDDAEERLYLLISFLIKPSL